MFQYSDQDCCSRARQYCGRECASLLRDLRERAPPALALIKAIRAEHAAFIDQCLLQPGLPR